MIVGSAVLAAAGLAAGGWQWSARAAQAETRAAWSRLSACLVGDPLPPGETARARARRIQLGYASLPRTAEARWPGRCQKPAHQLYESLREHGMGKGGPASQAEDMAAKIERGTADDEIFAMFDPLFKAAEEGGLVASPTSEGPAAPTPASPLRMADLAGAAVTTAEVPTTSVYTELVPGEDRHAIVDDPRAGAPALCTLPSSGGAFTCRPLSGALAGHHGLRLLGTTDPGAAPLVFAGLDGEGGIYRADTGELVASARAHSGYSAKDGYVAIQTWPSPTDGTFEVLEQRAPGAAVKRTTVKPDAQKSVQKTTTIHRTRILWDKLLIQMLDEGNLDTSPWVAEKSLGREDLGGAFHRIVDLNWINTIVTGCRGPGGTVVRFGPSEAMLLFNGGDRWQGPLRAEGLGDLLRCDGGGAVFLSGWPVRVKRCNPAGCDDQTPEGGFWPTDPAKGTSTVAFDFADGKVIVAWWTDRNGVRFRAGSPAQIGKGTDTIVFDDLAGPNGEPARTSVLSGIRLLAAGRGAVLLLATSDGLRAIRLGLDGTFAPATITR
jgi:hypothetical protein